LLINTGLFSFIKGQLRCKETSFIKKNLLPSLTFALLLLAFVCLFVEPPKNLHEGFASSETSREGLVGLRCSHSRSLVQQSTGCTMDKHSSLVWFVCFLVEKKGKAQINPCLGEPFLWDKQQQQLCSFLRLYPAIKSCSRA
jgi:hypothetical protein